MRCGANTSNKACSTTRQDQVPRQWRMQCLTSMACSGHRGFFFWFFFGRAKRQQTRALSGILVMLDVIPSTIFKKVHKSVRRRKKGTKQQSAGDRNFGVLLAFAVCMLVDVRSTQASSPLGFVRQKKQQGCQGSIRQVNPYRRGSQSPNEIEVGCNVEGPMKARKSPIGGEGSERRSAETQSIINLYPGWQNKHILVNKATQKKKKKKHPKSATWRAWRASPSLPPGLDLD